MNQERLMQVVLAPIVSEKSNMLAEKRGQIAFKVLPSATKPEIKAAIKLLFGVDVDSVTTINVKGKSKRAGRHMGKRQNWKKAYITLTPGQELDVDSATVQAE